MGKSETKKQLIIESAAILFNEKGIAGTSVDDIIAATDTSKGCFYGHFESKEELSFASVDYLFDKMTGRRNTALDKHVKAVDKIHAFMDMNKNPLKSYFKGGCPIINLSTESDDTNSTIKKKVKTMINTAISQFTLILQSGIDRGELSENLAPAEFANKMFVSIEGANAICRVLNSAGPMRLVIDSLKKELASYTLTP
ncbi:TetR/AcrR family transcriptional regulator [Mucilaginibacter sp.]|uniref:TetR/AcrR family transcriptional regulator n=1 Tax=Mucilaginibacter sp. TaxID=1882438 RepID=UPI0025D1C42D|nr:TetR/AcrR family transcriptional regulator [Mucilaginibacter sp.]